MNTSHAKAIKGMSIANIVLGALGILGTLIIWMGLGAGGAAVANSGYDYFYTDDGYIIQTSDINALLGMVGFFVFWVFICLALVMVAGIMGVRGANKPEKLKSVMVWNIVGAIASFLGAGIASLVLCIVVAVFANKDKQAFAAAPYAAPTAPAYGAPVQPQAPVAPQQPTAAAVAAVPVAAAVAAEAVAGAAMPATAAVSDPAPVTPAVAVAEQAVTTEAVPAPEVAAVEDAAATAAAAAAEPAVIIPDNYIEDAQAGVTIIEEAPADAADNTEEAK